MARLTVLALFVCLATSVYAQDNDSDSDATDFSILQASASSSTSAAVSNSKAADPSVVSIYFPGADQLPYVASLIGEGNGAKTLAISCGPGVDAETCGFPSSVTVTAGPSTAYVSVSNQEATFIYDCKISASTTAVCAETFNGNVAYIMTQSSNAAAASTSSVLTETLASTDITWMPITITAGKGATKTGSTVPTGSKQPDGSSGSNGNNANWSNLNWSNVNNMGSASSNTATASATASATATATATASGSVSTPTASSNTGANGQDTAIAGTTTTPAANTKTGMWPATWTGAAGRNSAVGSYIAGVLAVAGMVL